MKNYALLAFAALLLPLSSCGSETQAGAPEVLKFTAIPDKNTTELKEKFQPVAEYLSEKLGMTVEYVPAASYELSVSAFQNGDVHLAWFGGLTGVQARAKVEGSRAIAQGVTDPKFKTYFIAHESTGIEPSEDFPMALEGKSFTFGSASSTSGRLMPEHFIRQATDKSPEEFFGMPNAYSNGHDLTAELVHAGTFDAGALNFVVYDEMVKDGRIDPAVCKKIWETPEYADYNWTAHPALGDELTDRLQQALLDMKDPKLLAAIQRPDGLIKATNADFQSIHELAVALDQLR